MVRIAPNGQDISAMQRDVQVGYEAAASNSPYISGVVPVGAAWDRAMQTGVADSNPYDDLMPGQLNLWAPDAYHASAYGYYLERLMLFGSITGVDPLSLGVNEQAASDLGFTSAQTLALQRVARDQLAIAVPEPSSLVLLVSGMLGLIWVRRRTNLAMA
ncbi:MAG TPA: PEP-CTERM sorting domain-containing protein [Roseomonas sp.]|jgi:hypothetical protein